MNITELNEYKSIRNLFTFSEYSKRLNVIHKNNSLKNFIKNKEYILTLRKNKKKENNQIDSYIKKLCEERKINLNNNIDNNNGNNKSIIKKENEFSIFDNIIPKKKKIKQNLLNIIRHNKTEDEKIFKIKEKKRKYPILIPQYSPNYNSIYKHSPTYRFNSEKRFFDFNEDNLNSKIKKKFIIKKLFNNNNYNNYHSESNENKNTINTIFNNKNLKHNKTYKYYPLNNFNKNTIINFPFKNTFLVTSLSHNELYNSSTLSTSQSKNKYKTNKNIFEKVTTIS